MISCRFEDGTAASLRHVTVSTLVLKDNKILLGKRGTFKGRPILESGKWGPLGGFMDRDENLEEAVKREIMEESGWEVENITLFRVNSNPDRPAENRQNIDFVFFAEADKKVGTSDEEVLELKWFLLESLPPKEEIAFDHAENIELYKKYLQEKFALPYLKS